MTQEEHMTMSSKAESIIQQFSNYFRTGIIILDEDLKRVLCNDSAETFLTSFNEIDPLNPLADVVGDPWVEGILDHFKVYLID